MGVYDKLLSIQTELKAPKNQYNAFGKYNYRNCEDIQEAVKPLLLKANAVLVVGDELVQVGERYYIKAVAQFIDCETGTIIENTAYAREEQDKKGMDASQVTGSTSSYARKYALNGLFCIDDMKDADNYNNAAKTSKSKPSAPPKTTGGQAEDKVTESMIRSIESLIAKYSSKGLTSEKILKSYGLQKMQEMSINTYKDCMNKLKLYEKDGKKQ